MSGPDGTSETTSGGSSGGSNSFLPWHLIPHFKPGETEVNEYTRRLEFLANIWPKEHLPLLAPRACMLCEGSAFAKVVRLDPEKLRVSSIDGVKLVVSTLGGVWGQSRLEKKYERFERAIFGTIPKADETHTSYLARHEVQYEDLIGMGATLEEMRAYILLRNSGLSAEDKKRIIIEAKGELEYGKVTSALQLLGSKFFGEVQSGGVKVAGRTKTYDVNLVDESEQDIEDHDESIFVSMETSEDQALEVLMAEGDEDALTVQQFEDTIIESLQSDPEVASCLNAYADARRRLLDKARGRGFWGPQKGVKGKGKGGKHKGGFRSQFRKPLAQRILESTCRICNQKGHWKAECPQRNKHVPSASSQPGSAAFAGVVIDASQDGEMLDVIDELPSEAVAFMVDEVRVSPNQGSWGHGKPYMPNRFFPPSPVRYSWNPEPLKSQLMRVRPDLTRRLQALCRKSPTTEEKADSMPPPADPLRPTVTGSLNPVETACFVSHGSSGIVDLGASMSVIGHEQFVELCRHLPKHVKQNMHEAPCSVNFRFGNDSTVTGKRAVFFPVGQQWIKVVVVPSNTPFLIANSVFRALGAIIDTGANLIHFQKLGRSIPMVLTDRKLYRLDLAELLDTRPNVPQKESAVAQVSVSTEPNVESRVVSENFTIQEAKSMTNEAPSNQHVRTPCPDSARLKGSTGDCPEQPFSDQKPAHHGIVPVLRSADRSSPSPILERRDQSGDHQRDQEHEAAWKTSRVVSSISAKPMSERSIRR